MPLDSRAPANYGHVKFYYCRRFNGRHWKESISRDWRMADVISDSDQQSSVRTRCNQLRLTVMLLLLLLLLQCVVLIVSSTCDDACNDNVPHTGHCWTHSGQLDTAAGPGHSCSPLMSCVPPPGRPPGRQAGGPRHFIHLAASSALVVRLPRDRALNDVMLRTIRPPLY